MNRRWIHNDTPCRDLEDADAGFECEVVDAAAYDSLRKKEQEYLELIVDLVDVAGVSSWAHITSTTGCNCKSCVLKRAREVIEKEYKEANDA